MKKIFVAGYTGLAAEHAIMTLHAQGIEAVLIDPEHLPFTPKPTSERDELTGLTPSVSVLDGCYNNRAGRRKQSRKKYHR